MIRSSQKQVVRQIQDLSKELASMKESLQGFETKEEEVKAFIAKQSIYRVHKNSELSKAINQIRINAVTSFYGPNLCKKIRGLTSEEEELAFLYELAKTLKLSLLDVYNKIDELKQKFIKENKTISIEEFKENNPVDIKTSSNAADVDGIIAYLEEFKKLEKAA